MNQYDELFKRSRILRWIAFIAGYITPSMFRNLMLEVASAAAKHTNEGNVYRVLWNMGFVPSLEDARKIKTEVFGKSEVDALRELGVFADGYVDIDDMGITIPRIYYIQLTIKEKYAAIGFDTWVRTDSYKAPDYMLFIPANYDKLYVVSGDYIGPYRPYPGFRKYGDTDNVLILDDLSRIFISEEEIVKKYGNDYKRLFNDIPIPVGLPIKKDGTVDMRSIAVKDLRLRIAAVAKASKMLSGEAVNLGVELSMSRWLPNSIEMLIHYEQDPEVKKILLRNYAYSTMRYYTCSGVGTKGETLFYTGKVLEWERKPESQPIAYGAADIANVDLMGFDIFTGKEKHKGAASQYMDIVWRARYGGGSNDSDLLDETTYDEYEPKSWKYLEELKPVISFVDDRGRALMLTKEFADILKIYEFFNVFNENYRWYSRIYWLFERKNLSPEYKQLWNIKYDVLPRGSFENERLHGLTGFLVKNYRYLRYLNPDYGILWEIQFHTELDPEVAYLEKVNEDFRRRTTYLRTPDPQFFRDYTKCAEKIYMEVAGDCNIHAASYRYDRFCSGRTILCGAYSVHCMSDQRFEGAASSDPSVLVMPVEESAVGGILESWPIGLYNDMALLGNRLGNRDADLMPAVYIEFPTLIVRREIADNEIDPDRKPVKRRYRAVYLNVYEFDAEIPYAYIHSYPPPRFTDGFFREDMDPYPSQVFTADFNEVKIYSEHIYGLRPVYSIVNSLRAGYLDPVSAADLFHAVGIVAVATKPECMDALLRGETSKDVLRICCENCYKPGKEFLPHGARPIFRRRGIWGGELLTKHLSKPMFTADDYIALYARIAYAASKHLEEITRRTASIALSRSKKDPNRFASPAGASLFARHLMDVVLSAYMLTRWDSSCSAKRGEKVVALNEENLLRILRSLPRNTPLGMLPWEVRRGPMAPDVPSLDELERIFDEKIWPIARPGGYIIPRPELMSNLATRPLYKGLAIVSTLGEGHEVSRFILRSIGERIEVLRRRMEDALREADSPSEASVYEELKRIPPERLGTAIPSKDALGRARIAASKRYRVIADEYGRALKAIGKALKWFGVAEDLLARIEEIVGKI